MTNRDGGLVSALKQIVPVAVGISAFILLVKITTPEDDPVQATKSKVEQSTTGEAPIGEPVAANTDSARTIPGRLAPEHLRGTRTPVDLTKQKLRSGIEISPGVFLPPLNGVCDDDDIPPIRRNRRLPPPGKVVAKLVDLSGQEWWLHEDGSQTSCSYASITRADGSEETIVSTQHGAPQLQAEHGVLQSKTAGRGK